MLSLNDIKKALTGLLKDVKGGINIFCEDIEQIDMLGTDVFPLLYIQLIQLSSSITLDGKSRNRVILVDITFMEKSKSSNETMYDVAELITTKVGIGCKVKDRFLKIFSVGTNIADDTLHVTFNLDFYDDLMINSDETDLYESISL